MSFAVLMAAVEDVPTDRFVIGVTTPSLTDLSDEDEASRAPAPEQEPVQEAAPEPAAERQAARARRKQMSAFVS